MRDPRDPRDGERLGPPRVEPLPDIAWMRIERELWTTLDSAQPAPRTRSRQVRAWWIAVPAIAIAAVVLLWIGLRSTGPSGPISPMLADGSPARVVSGDSSSTLTFGDAHITLDARSAVAMNRDIAMPIATLERGAAWFAIAPREGRSPFVVVAGDVFVRVIGTRFHVARHAEEVAVEVERGVVEVQYRGSKIRLTAAERWSSEDPTRATPRLVSSSSYDAVARSTPKPDDSPSTSMTTPSTSTTTPTPRSASTPAPATSTTASPAPSASTATSASTPSTSTPPSPATTVAPTTPVAPTEPTITAPKTPTQPARDLDRIRFEQLSQLEATDYPAALSGYLELSRKPGPWAGPALYAAARLATDRRDRTALDLVTAYLRRFPRGANAADARKLLVHLKGESQ